MVHNAGMRTAWSDKHPTYELLNDPSGTGVQDLFTPEINSDAPTLGSPGDWTTDNLLTQQYDGYKVQAVINEIRGLDHSGTNAVGTPALFGMNFQTISTAQKLPVSQGQPGGYLADGVTPGPVLMRALDDGMLMWLNDHSDAASGFVKNFLLTHSGTGNDINGQPKAYIQSGLANVFAGRDAAAYFNVAPGDPRVPDIFGISQYGTVYTGKMAKIAEHVGANPRIATCS